MRLLFILCVKSNIVDISNGYLTWEFAVAFCCRNLPQLFTMGVRCRYLLWLFTLEILLYVNKIFWKQIFFIYEHFFSFRKIFLLKVFLLPWQFWATVHNIFYWIHFYQKLRTKRTKTLWQHVLVRINFLHFLYLKNFLAKYNLLQIIVSCSDLNSPKEIIFYF